MRLTFCTLASAVLGLASSSFAVAQMPATPSCSGRINIVRVSEIKPGMMDTFDKAVAAQKAWYQATGTQDEITIIHVFDTKTGEYVKTEALTTHSQVPDSPRPKHDAGYDAFVALFNSSSTIKSSYVGCEQK